MPLKLNLIWVLFLAVAFVGCNTVQESLPKQEEPTKAMVKLEEQIEGADNEIRVVSFVFEQPINLPEARDAIERYDINLLSIKFFVEGVSGTLGYAQIQSPAQAFARLETSMRDDIKTSLDHDQDVVAPKLLNLSREEFEASHRWQMEAISLIDRAQQRAAIKEVLQSERPAIYAVTLQGQVTQLRSFANEFNLEGLANLEFGSSVMIPKPQSLQLREETFLLTHQAVLLPNELYEQILTFIHKNLGFSSKESTVPEVWEEPFEIETTASSQSFPNRGNLYYYSPGYKDSYGKVLYDDLNVYAYWDNPGDWNYSYSGVEIDFNVYDRYIYGGCYSTTNLPRGYDDCPTAGVSENNNTYIAFGFGSFDAKQIRASYRYYGFIDLYTNNWYKTNTRFDWNLTASETARVFCTDSYSIWCRGTKDSKSVATSPDFSTGSNSSSSWR